MATVISKNADEKLPLEKAMGLRIPRGPPGDHISEIVRFTSKAADNPGLSRELLDMLAAEFSNNTSIKKIYVFTSKKHHVLYRRLKIKHRLLTEDDVEVLEPGKWDQARDVIMEINREDYQKALLK